MEGRPWYEQLPKTPAFVILALVVAAAGGANAVREFSQETIPAIGDLLDWTADLLTPDQWRVLALVVGVLALGAFLREAIRARRAWQEGERLLTKMVDGARLDPDGLYSAGIREHAVPLLAGMRGEARLSRADAAEHSRHVRWMLQAMGGEVAGILKRVGDAIQSGSDD